MSQLTTEQFDKNKNNLNINIQYFVFENQTRHQRSKDRDENSYAKILKFYRWICTMTESDHGDDKGN